MKKWIKYRALVCFFVFVFPVHAAAAGGGSGVLTADGNEVSVGLKLPEGKTETITSLRLQLRVTAQAGTMGEPGFAFDSKLKSTVKDAEVHKEKDGVYLVDLILSGKKDQDIFNGNEYAALGRLSVKPNGDEYQILVEIAGDLSESGEPVVKYMDAGGKEAMPALLADTGAAVVKNTRKSAFGQEPKLRTSVKKGSNAVMFQWSKNEEANGYILYEYDAASKTYREFKTIGSPAVTAYSMKFKYATLHMFRLRAYRKSADGSITYGTYSPVSRVTLPPAKVKGFTVKKSSKLTFSWKKTDGAKGYQIYSGKKKNGKYKLLKTVKKGKTKKWSTKKMNSKKTYYKVRAYVTGENGKRIYGDFSKIKAK